VTRASMFATAAVVVAIAVVPQAATAPGSGLAGKILRGPLTPVCREDRPCYAPFKGTITFTPVTADPSVATPVRTQSQADGDYRVMLDPMKYRVTVGVRATRFTNRVKPAFVTVSKNTIRRVNLIIDTGIR
jgi:hypothetical protein